MDAATAIDETRKLGAQTKIEMVRGLTLRRTKNGIPIARLHYTADPDRDPELHPEWKKTARAKYSSQMRWDREQEIVDNAGGGQLVFADTLLTWWDKIVIEDPKWRPDPGWTVIAGFDHGRTNPTALEKSYVDFQGNIILAGEYYMPGKEVWENVPEILKLPDVDRFEACWSDPSIFDQKTQQETGKKARAIASLYAEHGVGFLNSFGGNRNDITFAERLLSHWADLENRAPSLRIVCRNYSDRPQPGLHPWDCPNLLWELLQIRRKKLTATQLLVRNTSEEIIDKNNHAVDACKYLVMSLPEPSKKSAQRRIAEAVKPFAAAGDFTNVHLTAEKMRREIEREEDPSPGSNARQRLRKMGRFRRR